jgi:DNA replication protein DnaC
MSTVEHRQIFASVTDKVPCSVCANLTSQFHAEGFYGLCGDCYGQRREEENKGDRPAIDGKNKQSMELRMEKWNNLCPELYRTGDTSFIQTDKLVSVTKWKMGQRGLMVTGRSRAGKTTSVWHLLHKLYVLEAKTFKAISEPEFSIERDRHSRQGSLDGFLAGCIRADVFFLDDLGHAATNSRNLEELYHIIETRTSWKRPVIVTTQFTREELEEKGQRAGSAKTALAILNRISSFCYHVAF